MKISPLQKLLSYLFPITLRKAVSGNGQKLSLLLSNGNFQLGANTALYSDGVQYHPMQIAFDYLKPVLHQKKNLLFLGGGIGSGLMMYEKYAPYPATDVVELEPVILQWMKEILPPKIATKTNLHEANATHFVAHQEQKFDLIISDVFVDRIVPPELCDDAFLQHIKRLLMPGAHFVLNYIEINKEEYQTLQNLFAKIFPNYALLKNDRNRIFVATV